MKPYEHPKQSTELDHRELRTENVEYFISYLLVTAIYKDPFVIAVWLTNWPTLNAIHFGEYYRMSVKSIAVVGILHNNNLHQ